LCAGYEVTFIYNFWVAWALPFDEKIIKDNPRIKWKMAGCSPFIKRGFYFSRIVHKCFRSLSKIFPANTFIASQATTRGFSSLAKMVSNKKADLYIAHNVGALPAAALAAKKHQAKYAFDAEDYHRGQFMEGSVMQRNTILLEDKYLPNATYITAASPLIAEQYTKHYNRKVIVINNVFSKKYLVKEVKDLFSPIKLFWFSQTIGKGRGIEDVVLALKDLPAGSYTLTLLGKHNAAIKNYFIELGKNKTKDIQIDFINPTSPEEVFKIAATHDIGLALEQPKELNRDLCLTNKIFTYLLAGNAIIFSDTNAQRRFLEENEGIGSIYECGNIELLKIILRDFLNNPQLVQNMKINSKQLAATRYNWEKESEALKELIEKVFI
jgi:glycosyltransferase involved in cell wall biosynthesis